MIQKINHSLRKVMSEAGFRSEVVSIDHLPDLQSELKTLIQNNYLGKEFYDDQLWDFSFKVPEALPAAQSIIITAAWQSKVIVSFNLDRKKFSVVIPPIYSYATDRKISEVMTSFLSSNGYGVCEAVLPLKALVVHSGFAVYGRNNITYMGDWGSHFRLKAFFSDMPCDSDHWNHFRMAEICQRCTACLKNCPTRAIQQNKFTIHHEHCLTYLNESVKNFPDWVESEWHHCLIGCMACQDICPLNKELRGMECEGCEFNEVETRMILEGTAREDLPTNITIKLKKLNMFDDYIPIQRNLNALIHNQIGESPQNTSLT